MRELVPQEITWVGADVERRTNIRSTAMIVVGVGLASVIEVVGRAVFGASWPWFFLFAAYASILVFASLYRGRTISKAKIRVKIR